MARTVLIVDDQAAFRHIARAMLSAGGWEVVGEAVDGPSALAATARLQPELVLLDVNLPGDDGIDVARQLAATRTSPAVVLTSSRDASDFGRRLREAPALGFVPKDELSSGALAALMG